MENVLMVNEKSMGDFTKEEINWLNVLKTNKNYNEEEFVNYYLNNSEVTLSIFKYRNYLMEKQNNIKNIDESAELIKDILSKNYKLIKNDFEKIFLEPISDMNIDVIIKLIKTQEKLIDLIQLHNLKKTNRLMSLLLLLI